MQFRVMAIRNTNSIYSGNRLEIVELPRRSAKMVTKWVGQWETVGYLRLVRVSGGREDSKGDPARWSGEVIWQKRSLQVDWLQFLWWSLERSTPNSRHGRRSSGSLEIKTPQAIAGPPNKVPKIDLIERTRCFTNCVNHNQGNLFYLFEVECFLEKYISWGRWGNVQSANDE